MKNIKLIIAALVSFAALSCVELESPDTTPETNQDSGLMTLTLSTGKQTKTHISDVTNNGVTEIHWDKGDQIRVFTDVEYKGVTNADNYDGNATSFSMNGDPNGDFARFGGKIPAKSTKFWAVYPTSSGKSCSTGGNGSDIVASIPSSQKALANSFASGLNVSVAKAEIKEINDGFMGAGDYELTEPIYVNFKNVCSLLKFTAPADASKIASVLIAADKAIVGDLTINYSGENPQVTGVSGGNSITMNGPFAANTDYYFVLAPVAISDLSLYVNTSDNKQYSTTKTFANDSQLQLKPGQYKSIGKLNINKMPSLGVDFDIQDEGGILNGTNVIFTFSNPTITNVDLKVIKGKTTVRSIQAASLELDENNQYTSSCLAESVSTWPYLPKGTYVISGSYKADGIPVIVSGLELKIEDSPNFAPQSFTAYTSYTKYTKYKSGTSTALAEANECDGTSIYIGQIGGISENIYNNGNYASCFKAKFNGSENEITASYHSEVGKNRFSMPAYGHYDSVVLVFDEVASSSATIDCDVTGIPYTLNPSANDAANQWSINGNVKWNDGGKVRLGYNITGNWGKELTKMEKTFYAPDNIPVIISCNGTATGDKVFLSFATTFNLYVSETNYYTVTSGKNKSTSINSGAISCELDSDTPVVKLENTNGTNKACSQITQLSIVYTTKKTESY